LPGHLVTITSPEESDFVLATFPAAVAGRYWLGGFQDRSARSYREPDGGWRWVTGEPWAFARWSQAPNREPNNSNPTGREDYLAFVGSGGWNDNVPTERLGGFIVEWEPVARDAVR
jgi:hypothetical protein